MQIQINEIIKQMNDLTYSIILVGHKICEPTWGHPLRQSPYHTMWLITKGSGQFHINGIEHVAEPGKLFFVRPGTTYERKTSPLHPLEYYIIRFSCAALFEVNDEWHFIPSSDTFFPLEGAFKLQNAPQAINLNEQIHHLWKRKGKLFPLRLKIMFTELLLTIAQDFLTQKLNGETAPVIEMTVDYMVNHYHEDITLYQLGTMAGLSISHYSHLFKKAIGYSPIEYLTHFRVERAKELLALSEYRLKYVARSVGYQDEFYFSRLFKKIVGISPSEFSKKHRFRINPE